jgi:hypothetical protein
MAKRKSTSYIPGRNAGAQWCWLDGCLSQSLTGSSHTRVSNFCSSTGFLCFPGQVYPSVHPLLFLPRVHDTFKHHKSVHIHPIKGISVGLEIRFFCIFFLYLVLYTFFVFLFFCFITFLLIS